MAGMLSLGVQIIEMPGGHGFDRKEAAINGCRPVSDGGSATASRRRLSVSGCVLELMVER